METLRSLIKGFEEKTGVRFTGEIKINGRLTRSLGRCQAIITQDRFSGEIKTVNPIGIDISKRFIEVATTQEIIDVLAHEFAHYCTYKTVGQHDHSTSTFKMYCELLETSHAPSMTTKNKLKNKYDIYCTCCGKHIGGKSTARAGVVQNPTGYRSGCCKASVRVEKNF